MKGSIKFPSNSAVNSLIDNLDTLKLELSKEKTLTEFKKKLSRRSWRLLVESIPQVYTVFEKRKIVKPELSLNNSGLGILGFFKEFPKKKISQRKNSRTISR